MNDVPAFPVLIVDRPEELTHFNGMTLRDYFAAKAMEADMAGGLHETDFAWGAKRAYKMADTMMKAREE